MMHCSSSSAIVGSVDSGTPQDGSNGTVDSATVTRQDSGAVVTDSAVATDSAAGATDSAVDSSGDAGGCAMPEGGTPGDPGFVACPCGTNECSIMSNVCCYTENEAGAVVASCQAKSSCDGIAAACDEKADCTGANVCCLLAQSLTATGVSMSCQAQCSGGLFSIQLCKTDGECGATGPCIAQTCSLAGTALVLQACGNIPTCTAM
jgi:hypothetical protein